MKEAASAIAGAILTALLAYQQITAASTTTQETAETLEMVIRTYADMLAECERGG